MLFHTTFKPDPARTNEWLACLWQGPGPADLKVRAWLGLSGEPRAMVLVWEGGKDAEAFVERVFGSFGEIETKQANESSGMASAFARDLDAYETMVRERGLDPKEIARQVDLRRRGMAAPDHAAAIAAAKAWATED